MPQIDHLHETFLYGVPYTPAVAAKKLGRPPIENPRTARFELRCTEEQKQRWAMQAASEGVLDLGDWARDVLDRASRGAAKLQKKR